MKLLQIINSLSPGGAEKLVVETALQYSKQNFDVSILVLTAPESPLLEKIKSYSEINFINLNCKNVYNPLNSIKIKKHLKNYDLIHVHLFPCLYWVALASIIRNSKVPMIFTEHNSFNKRRKNAILKQADKFFYRYYDTVVTISNSVHQNLEKHLGEGYHLQKIYNGIHTQTFFNAKPYEREELGLVKSDRILIQVASFTPQKDQATLVKSLLNLPDRVKLLLVGKGPELVTMKNLVSSLNLQLRVQFLGVRNDVPRLLKTADIVVLSTHYEGLSLSCIEAMACGKPFVASDVSGVTEVVENAGILVEENNPLELSNSICRLMEDSNYSEKITQNCLKKVQQFTIDKMVENYINLYNEVFQKSQKQLVAQASQS
ncbi:glycosyltransferase family 4 protein [Galbibacter mesophilus]|uniref:glycosyltransferase family 4 protein n=1 Tax=Galbibacter mesophilus TaxID=379069 RepID=UPI00191FAD6C|nr:glycosyltransferase family 4 protein [Galbibacter mesophilus]MCM5663421.1 glycosyltransferase family 4 protein [Galbibacter mesophilus]